MTILERLNRGACGLESSPNSDGGSGCGNQGVAMANTVRHSKEKHSARVPPGGPLHAKLRESKDMDPEVREMLHINEEQRRYYEQADGAKESEVNGFATNLWRRWGARALSVFEESQIDESLVDLHQRWIGGNFSSLKVLDLGVGYGNPLSMKFAREAREYVAIDLSAAMVEWFQRQLKANQTRNARAVVADF